MQTKLLGLKAPYAKTLEQLQDSVLATHYKAKSLGYYMAPDENDYICEIAEQRYNQLPYDEDGIES